VLHLLQLYLQILAFDIDQQVATSRMMQTIAANQFRLVLTQTHHSSHSDQPWILVSNALQFM
jgi:hypothetical protein